MARIFARPVCTMLGAMAAGSTHSPAGCRGKVVGIAFCLALLPAVTAAQTVTFENGNEFDVYSDFRLRYEYDWDSVNASGARRDDRDRYRIRYRAGFEYRFASDWRLGARLRSGSNASQQSPHCTFYDNDNPEGDCDIVPDRWYLDWQGETVTLWGGRNGFSFWKQNELFWDDDATLAGGHLAIKGGVLPSGLTLNAGAFTLPDGMKRFNGALYAGQAVYATGSNGRKFNAAAGFFRFDGERGAKHLLDGNGERNYSILHLGGSTRFTVRQQPLTVGLDFYHNLADNADGESNGIVAQARWDGLSTNGKWHVGYSFARIERLAVNASFAQDDWMRFGNASQTRASNFRGSEVRLGYAATRRLGILARFYTVESLNSIEDGKRFRLDFNYNLPLP